MNIETKTNDEGILILTLAGESLDASNTAAFRKATSSALSKHQRAVMDMSNLEFVDSSGLGALLACHRIMAANSGALKLFGLTKPVQAVFDLMRMHRIFSVHNTSDDAMRSF